MAYQIINVRIQNFGNSCIAMADVEYTCCKCGYRLTRNVSHTWDWNIP